VGKEGNQRNKEWFDEESAKVISEKNNARKECYKQKQELWKISRIKKGSK
jgi:hypothetical protein